MKEFRKLLFLCIYRVVYMEEEERRAFDGRAAHLKVKIGHAECLFIKELSRD